MHAGESRRSIISGIFFFILRLFRLCIKNILYYIFLFISIWCVLCCDFDFCFFFFIFMAIVFTKDSFWWISLVRSMAHFDYVFSLISKKKKKIRCFVAFGCFGFCFFLWPFSSNVDQKHNSIFSFDCCW